MYTVPFPIMDTLLINNFSASEFVTLIITSTGLGAATISYTPSKLFPKYFNTKESPITKECGLSNDIATYESSP